MAISHSRFRREPSGSERTFSSPVLPVGRPAGRPRYAVSQPGRDCRDNGVILLRPNSTWTLSVEPEPPPAGEARVRIRTAPRLRFPQRLDVHSNAAPVVTGSIGISGFGSALNFDTASGAPASDGVSIDFPFSVPGHGPSQATAPPPRSSPPSARRLQRRGRFPLNFAALNTFGDAPHGGSLVVQLSGPSA